MKEMDEKIVYTLGNGWWPWQDIPEQYRAPSILRCSVCEDGRAFLPQALFDGTLQSVFKDRSKWKAVLEKKKKGNLLHLPALSIPSIGLKYQGADYQLMHDVSVYERVDQQFKFFNEKKHGLLFVLDFHTGKCRDYTNQQILSFEKYLVDDGFDLRNFIYVTNSKDDGAASRFDGCRAKAFVYDVDSNRKFVSRQNGSFHNTKCLFEVDGQYVRQQLDRILGKTAGLSAGQAKKGGKIIYPLGCGCWCNTATPGNLRAPSIFRNGGGTIQEKFLPTSLFNGDVEKCFFDPSNWTCKLNRGVDALEDSSTFNLDIDLVPVGLRFGHMNKSQFPYNDKEHIRKMFGFFNANKHRLLFVIDFTRGAYRGCSNRQLLEFEKLLKDQGFDLRNFIYVDIDQRDVPDRFDGCEIKLFSYDSSESKYVDGRRWFKACKKLFADDKKYVLEQVRRISGDETLDY